MRREAVRISSDEAWRLYNQGRVVIARGDKTVVLDKRRTPSIPFDRFLKPNISWFTVITDPRYTKLALLELLFPLLVCVGIVFSALGFIGLLLAKTMAEHAQKTPQYVGSVLLGTFILACSLSLLDKVGEIRWKIKEEVLGPNKRKDLQK